MLERLLDFEINDPAECTIRVGASGESIETLYPYLTEVTVQLSRKEPATATLKFFSQRDEFGLWTVQDQEILNTWEPIVIEANFGSITQEVMRGFIREVKAEYPEDPASATVTVECQDDSIELDRVHRRRSWGEEAPTNDLAVLSEILAAYPGLSAAPDSETGLSDLTLSQDGTDAKFLLERAEANGYELIIREGTVYFGPMRVQADPQQTILVYAGSQTHCYSFSATVDAHQPDSVAFELSPTEGAEPLEKIVTPNLPKVLGAEEAKSDSQGLEDFVWRMGRQSGSEDELTARAQGKANELAMKVKAEGELDGSAYRHVLLPGLPVAVDGVGDMMGGSYYVDSVTHTFTDEGYRQSFVLIRNGIGDDLAEGLLDALSGVR